MRRFPSSLGGSWSRRRVLQTAGLVALFLTIAVAVDLLVRYLPAIQALQAGRDAALHAQTDLKVALAEGHSAQFGSVTADLTTARTDFTDRSSVIDQGWVINVVGHLPWVSDQVQAAQAMRRAGAYGSQLGLDLIPVVQSMQPAATTAPKEGTLHRLYTAATSQTNLISNAQGDLDALDAAISQIPSGSLVGPLDHMRATLRSQGTSLSASAHAAVNLLQVAPAALGTTERRYLLLVNNPGEERPGGGYIGAIGEIDVQQGQILSETFADSAFSNGHIPPEPAPRPLDDYLFHGVPWELSDANWSADFPTSAADVSRLYKEATGHTIDGVISVDPVALSYVLQVIGPVAVPPYPQVISASNTLLTLNYITNSARPGDPGKVFLPPFAKALLDRLLSPATGKLSPLVSAIGRAVAEKHLLFFFTDPLVQQVVTDSSAGGVLGTPALDGLLVTDANLSGGKEDLFVKRRYAFSATVAANGTAQDTVTLSYTNPAQTLPANLNLEPSLGAVYEDYIQVFAPAGATLDDILLTQAGATRSVSPEDITTARGRSVFAYFLSVPPGESATLEFHYSGAFGQTGGGYSLDWIKQVNALTVPITVDVKTAGRSPLHWSSDLSVDRTFSTP